MTDHIIHIMLADDNLDEHIFFAHALKNINGSTILHTVKGGIELLSKLDQAKDLPDILFLDVNMPFKNGKDCLAVLRADSRYAGMPIVMYSTSDAQRDVQETYTLGADLYMRKPTGIEDLHVMLSLVLGLYRRNSLHKRDKDSYILTHPQIQ